MRDVSNSKRQEVERKGPSEDELGGLRRGFLLGQGRQSDQAKRPQSGSSETSSNFGSFKRGFLQKDVAPRSQARADQTQSPESAVQLDSKDKGKGKQSDQDKGLSGTGESSRQQERLSEFQLEVLRKQFEQLPQAKQMSLRSQLPDHVRIQFSSYDMKQMIQESRERGLVPQDTAATYMRSIEMMTEKKLRGEGLTVSDDKITRNIGKILMQLESHKASEKLTDEMEDMSLVSDGDLLRRTKEIKEDAERSIAMYRSTIGGRKS
jgi:hypothetical protein